MLVTPRFLMFMAMPLFALAFAPNKSRSKRSVGETEGREIANHYRRFGTC
jgi:hypothetical protein